MCDEAGKPVKQTPKAAAQAAATAAPRGAVPATTVDPQVAAQVAVQVAAKVAAQVAARKDTDSKKAQVVDPEFVRAENEDDDGYDPYSDRRPVSEPLFERDPWS